MLRVGVESRARQTLILRVCTCVPRIPAVQRLTLRINAHWTVAGLWCFQQFSGATVLSRGQS